jgi:predicted O-methyltransferase YrrM
MKKIKHNYQSIEGWFNMEAQSLYLLENCPEDGIFVELGCFKGKSTSFIVTEIINQNRDVNFNTIDSFEGATNSNDKNEVKAYNGISNILEEFKQNTKHLNKYFDSVKCLSHEGADFFNDNSVDVIFIDAGHSYEAVKKDIEAWLPKMKKGGIMAGHDYWAWEGVRKAVNEAFRQVDRVENDCWFKTIK